MISFVLREQFPPWKSKFCTAGAISLLEYSSNHSSQHLAPNLPQTMSSIYVKHPGRKREGFWNILALGAVRGDFSILGPLRYRKAFCTRMISFCTTGIISALV